MILGNAARAVPAYRWIPLLLIRATASPEGATAAANALDHPADIANFQEWLGHANIATTRTYDHRKTRAEDSPTFKVAYRATVPGR